MIVLTDQQRDEIVKALNAIERQIRDLVDESDWQALFVIDTNLSLIRSNLTEMPRGSSN